MKASKSLSIEESHMQTIERYSLFSDLLDSNGIDKLRLNVRSLLASNSHDAELLDFCQKVLFHDWMKAFGLHQLILTYIEWQNEKLESLKSELETEAEA